MIRPNRKTADAAASYLGVHGDVVINRKIHLRAAMALDELIVAYQDLRDRYDNIRAAASEAASAPGKDWLSEQLRLCKVLVQDDEKQGANK